MALPPLQLPQYRQVCPEPNSLPFLHAPSFFALSNTLINKSITPE
jgi:hypothetical protein